MADQNSPTPSTPAVPLSQASSAEQGHRPPEAITKAQDALRKIDAALKEPAPAAAPNAEALAAMDQSLANDLDEMLQSDPASVNAVLDDVFKEQAAVVQQLDESPRPLESPLPAPSPALAAPLMATAALASEAAKSPSPKTLGAGEPVPSAEAEVPAPPSVSHQNARSDTVGQAAMQSADTQNEDASVSRAARSQRSEDHELKASLPTGSSSGPAGVLARVGAAPARLIARLMNPVVSVLVVANYPLRKVPASLRPALDWLALSMLAWVPIVWVLAVMLGHKSTGSESAGPVTHEIVLPSLHAESTNAAAARK